MNSRTLSCVAALAASVAILQLPGLFIHAHAQDVKEQWNIATPPPAGDDTNAKPAPAPTAAATGAAKGGAPVAGENQFGLKIVKNPYTGDAAAIAQGKDLFVSYACSGCHGAGGGGGMCPPVINDTWVYGSDDTTLFNLVKLGSVGLRAKGYTRVGHENVVGDMPPFGSLLNEEQEWKLIAYVRSKYAGDPSGKNW